MIRQLEGIKLAGTLESNYTYIPQCEQVYIKLTLHEELRKVESNLRHYLLWLYFAVRVCVHTQMWVRATREKHLKLPLSCTVATYNVFVVILLRPTIPN